jgi:hypothetical protein
MISHVRIIAYRAPVEDGAAFVGTTELYIAEFHLGMFTLWTSLWCECPGVPVGRGENLNIGKLIAKPGWERVRGACCCLSDWPSVYSSQSPMEVNRVMIRSFTDIFFLAYVA